MVDWSIIRQDYLSGGYTLQGLAEKYKLSLAALKNHSTKEGWAAQKKAYISGIHEEARRMFNEEPEEPTRDEKPEEPTEEPPVVKIVRDLERETRIADRISELLEKATREQMEVSTLNTEGEVVSIVDIAALEKVARILKQIEEVKRSLFGLTTAQEDRLYKINLEKLDIERQRLKHESNDDDEGGGVLILPEVDSYNGSEAATDE